MDWLGQQAEAIQEDELAKLPQGAFDSSIVLKHPENAAMNLKFLWDFFPASYNCPLREKVRVPAFGWTTRYVAVQCALADVYVLANLGASVLQSAHAATLGVRVLAD